MADFVERLSEALADRYVIVRELGAGGMAHVFLADDVKHDRKVAVKVMRPELSALLGPDRFLREIKVTARLNHPHILPLLDSGEARGFLYYVMPFVEGESLRDRLNREKQLPVDDAVSIAREVADALGAAHERNVIHRDIKPENILLERGHAIVADFGISRAVAEAGGEKLTITGMAVGTPSYVSPEQGSGLASVDPRADIYSLGCVLFEMLTGEVPYPGSSALAILAGKTTKAPPSVRDVRPAVTPLLESAIHTALSPLPADRHGTASQFAAALEQDRGSVTIASVRRSRRIFIAAVGALVIAAVLLWRFTQSAPMQAAPQTLAVLPFSNISGDPEHDYIAFGMTEELIYRLSAILSVKSRTSVTRYRDTDEPASQIAATLGVESLVDGSVSVVGDRVRILANLVHGQTEANLWSKAYDGEVSDILALQSEIAQAIADEIGATVSPADRSRLVQEDALDPVAFDAYRKGRFYWNQRTAEDLRRAIGYFEQAVGIEPDFARAYAGMADAYVLLAYSHIAALSPNQALPRAREAAEQAIILQDDLAAAYTSLAYVNTFEWNWEEVEHGFQRAIDLDPENGMTHFWFAAALAAMGRVDDAVQQALRGHDVDPLTPIVGAGLAWMYHFAGDHLQAVEQSREVLRIDPNFAIGHFRLGVAYGWLGRYEDAIDHLQIGFERSGGSPGFLAALARMYSAAGRPARAEQSLQQLLRMAGERYVPAYSIALTYLAIGDTLQSLDWLDKAYEERSLELTFIAVEPELDPLRGNLRFQEILERVTGSP